LEDKAISALSEYSTVFNNYVSKRELLTASCFHWKRNIFLYYEVIQSDIEPGSIFQGLEQYLETWAGENFSRYWVPMLDIYHADYPVTNEYWERNWKAKSIGKVIRLKPEMVASYIFYHYQYQEEKPGDWAKYALITIYENLLFFYLEEPDGPVQSPYKGKLNTSDSPQSQWGQLMGEHFMPWEDSKGPDDNWREVDLIFRV
jgi:hypothetical protein